MSKGDGFGHEKPNEGQSNDWITPKYIIDAFDNYAYNKWGHGCYFDLDPCSSVLQPWACARKAYTVEQDGLKNDWFGKVYCNPEYGSHADKWIRLLAEHGNGIALIFARTETKLWQEHIFPTAHGFLFHRKRIAFYEFLCECGKPRSWHLSPNKNKRHKTCENFRNTGNVIEGEQSGAPSCLIAWGNENRDALIQIVDDGTIPGAFLDMAFYTGSGRSGIVQSSMF